MALKTLVKISGVNNLSDARYGAGMGVELMGFNLNKSEDNYIDLNAFTEITNWISGVKIVGEFGDTNHLNIKEAISNYNLDFIQVDDINQISALEEIKIPLILRIDISTNTLQELENLLQLAKARISFFLFESENNNIDLNNIFKLSENFPIILDSSVSLENLDSIIQSSIKGIALQGGNEVQPGIRDFDEMADILEFLEIE